MKIMRHQSAKESHYDAESVTYDQFNEDNSRIVNQFLDDVLKKHKVKSVLDLTCGTGSQVCWLSKRGYDVTGSDINAKMLTIARKKAKQQKLDVNLLKGDIRNIKVGQFDAAISIFNAVGHLTKKDFEKAMRNIHRNLKKGGLYIFDIFNLDYLLHDNQITKLTIDWQVVTGKTRNREFQYSTIDNDGVLASYTTSFKQVGSGRPKMTESSQTLQVYTAEQLQDMLQKNGFKVLRQCGIDGSKFSRHKTERIVMIAKSI